MKKYANNLENKNKKQNNKHHLQNKNNSQEKTVEM